VQDSGSSSTSTSTRRIPILSVDDLANLPLWRAVVFNSNTRPVIVDALPWFRDKRIKALIDAKDVGASTPTATEEVVAHDR
jgi:type IV secretory pathway TraG/TraD family ATPase VirD4